MDEDADPFVPQEAVRDPQLQVVVGDHDRPVVDRERGANRSDLGRSEAPRQFGADLTKPCGAPANHRRRHFVSHGGRSRAGPIGIGKHVDVRQRRRRKVREICLELFVRFAGKAGDQVRTDRDVRQPFDQGVSQPLVEIETVGPPHSPEHGIARVLQWQVEMRSEPASAAGDELDNLGRAIHRLEGTDPEREVLVQLGQRAQQVDQSDARLEITAVGSQVNAGERDLEKAGGCDSPDLAKQVRDVHAAPCPTRCRDDAVAAVLFTPRLHAQRKSGPSGDTRFDRGAAAPVTISEPLCRAQVE